MTTPLVSVIILSYNNYRYLDEALDSLLSQDYPNIELILSNDASRDFNEAAVIDRLKKSNAQNIKRTLIINNKKNLGTVKSLNNAVRKAKGEFLIFFAGDDAFYDNQVITKFVKAFSKLPPNEYIVTSQLGMYDVTLQSLIQLFISKKDIRMLRHASPQELFANMSTRCIIAAASTCYRTTLFKKHGLFDERYRLIEDWSSALRFSRLGIKFHYQNFISFKHRDGGVSHGNVNGEKKLNKYYDLDLVNIMKNEVRPYRHLLSDRQRKKFDSFYKDHKWQFDFNYNLAKSSIEKRRKIFFQSWSSIVSSNYRDLKSYFLQQLTGKKVKLLLVGIAVSLYPWPNSMFNFYGNILVYSILLLILFQLYKIFVPRFVHLVKLLF